MTADHLNELAELLEDLRPRRVAHLSPAEIDAHERRRALAANDLRYQWGRAIAQEAESA